MKIPKEAVSVFKGKIFEVFQWEQKMYDRSTATFEALKRADTVQVLPVMNGELLLSFEEQPMKPRRMTFLGGRIEDTETPLEAAKRELLEESGIEAAQWELYKRYEGIGKIEWNTYFYLAKDCQKVDEQHLDSGEKIEIKNVTFDEFLQIVSHEDFGNPIIANDILRMRLSPMRLGAFRNSLFL